MKKLLLIVVVAALALTLVPLALAGGRAVGAGSTARPSSTSSASWSRNVADTTADPAAVSTITIKVKAGTKTVRAFRGTEAMITWPPTPRSGC